MTSLKKVVFWTMDKQITIFNDARSAKIWFLPFFFFFFFTFFFFHFLELKNGVEKSVLSFKVEKPLKCLALYLQTLQRPSNPKTTYTLLNPFIYMYICVYARARGHAYKLKCIKEIRISSELTTNTFLVKNRHVRIGFHLKVLLRRRKMR